MFAGLANKINKLKYVFSVLILPNIKIITIMFSKPMGSVNVEYLGLEIIVILIKMGMIISRKIEFRLNMKNMQLSLWNFS